MKTTDQDPWKKLIDQNREEYDSREPKDLWASIEDKLDDQPKAKEVKMVPLWKVYRVAAILIMALTAGYFLINDSEKPEEIRVAQTSDEDDASLAYSEEFIEAENYYTAEIDQKMSELMDLVDDESLIEEVNLLRDEFDELKKEMGDHVNDQRIVEAMIQNYRLRLNLLKEMLGEMKKETTGIKNRNYETNAI